MRVIVLMVAMVLGCGNNVGPSDTGRKFIGAWVCDSGKREIDCGAGVSVADLAQGLPTLLQFHRGLESDVVLVVRAETLVPGLPGGPSCELALNSPNGDDAVLIAESTCVDEKGQNIVVHESLAQVPWLRNLTFATSATTSANCHIDTQARCFPQ